MHESSQPLGQVRRFRVELADASDAVVRALNCFVIAGGQFMSLDLRRAGEGLALQVAARDLTLERARHLEHRLHASPAVTHATHEEAAPEEAIWDPAAANDPPSHGPGLCDPEPDELELAFPGCSLTHVLNVTSRNQLDVAIEILSLIRAAGGVLDGLHLGRIGGGLAQRLNVTGLRPHQTRVLASRIAALPGVEHASVEHQILRTA
jgi:hypothetical protein